MLINHLKKVAKNATVAKKEQKLKKQNLYLHAGMLMTIDEVKSYNLANERCS